MKNILETLKQHIQDHPPNYGDADSILDMLFWHYTEYNQIDNERIKERFTALRETLNLPSQEYDEVFYIVSDLCLEHGQLAFGEGMKAGMALIQELNG